MMTKQTFIVVLIILTCAFNIIAQDGEKMSKNDEKEVYQAKTEDVATIDGIIKATYEVISGKANEKRDWDRFNSLFHKDARLIPTGTNPQTKQTGAKAHTPEEYIKRSEPFMMKNGFFEKEIARKTEVYGNIAHVFSTYEGRYKLSDEKPFLRGINSFQLLNDGKRWWVMTIYWQAETPDNPLPKNYLEN